MKISFIIKKIKIILLKVKYQELKTKSIENIININKCNDSLFLTFIITYSYNIYKRFLFNYNNICSIIIKKNIIFRYYLLYILKRYS